ncbi:MAG: hypothetical protein K9M75_11795 [Phycisphaerae bacterium]|nr:hypothetical protein [Phycisphaerae bacterium]
MSKRHENLLIKDAIEEARCLLNDEFETVIDDEIAERYDVTINKLQQALDLLEEN